MKTKDATKKDHGGFVVGGDRLQDVTGSKVSDEEFVQQIWPTEADIDGAIDRIVAALSESCENSAAHAAAEAYRDEQRDTSVEEQGTLFHWSSNSGGVSDLLFVVSKAYSGMSFRPPEDYVVVEPKVNREFVSRCRLLGATTSEYELNKALLNARKAGLHHHLERHVVAGLSATVRDSVVCAAEIAARVVQYVCENKNGFYVSIDQILCDSKLRSDFDRIAYSMFSGYEEVAYRLGALSFRKNLHKSTVGSELLQGSHVLKTRLSRVAIEDVPEGPGVYLVFCEGRRVFSSWACSLRSRVEAHLKFGGERLTPPDTADVVSGPLEIEIFESRAGWKMRDAEGAALELLPSEEPSLNYIVRTG